MRIPAARVAGVATVLVLAGVWGVCAWLLYRTSVPALHLGGFDAHRFFPAGVLRRAARFTRGEDLLWLGGVVAEVTALAVLVRVLPARAATIGLGRIGTAVIVGIVLLTTLWFVSLPFGVAGLWWQHHWGLGPFDVGAWLAAALPTLGLEAVGGMATIVLVVGLAGRLGRAWMLAAWPVFVAVAALFAFAAGWVQGTGHPVRQAWLRDEVARLERVEQVRGTPVRVQTVSTYTNQVNAFTVGFGPSTRVVLWNTLFAQGFSRSEISFVTAHELGHVRSGHIVKAIGWSALVTLPALGLLELATRRRGGLANPANLPLALLVLVAATLVVLPFENAVSRRYESEADWRALNATHAPAAGRAVFEAFARTSLEQPDPPWWDYLWLESHPTLMQRIAMTERWPGR